MKFPDAMAQVIEGRRVARISWDNGDYCLLKNGWLMIFTKKDNEPSPTLHQWLINDGDMLADDWVEVFPLTSVN